MVKLKINVDECLRRFYDAHGAKYDYSKMEYTGPNDTVIIICPEHGEFTQRPNVHWNGSHCRKCANKNISAHKRMSLTKCIQLFKDRHGDKYDYSKVHLTFPMLDTVEIICPQHGSFKISANSHRKGTQCPSCGRLKKQRLPFSNNKCIEKFVSIHGNKYDYSRVFYNSAQEHVTIICPEHGEFMQQPYNHWNGHGCPSCGSIINVSKYENQIISYLNSLNIICENSNRNIISPYEIDIFIRDHNIGIEFNGNYWHSTANKVNKYYHLFKTELALKNNKTFIIHIFEDEWIYTPQIVKSRLKAILNKTPYKIYARKCVVRKIPSLVKTKFLNKYHIQGSCSSSINLGLYYHNKLVSIMTFGKRRFDQKEGFELIRYCTVSNFNIVGGAGKLLKYFERNYNPTRLISYADRRWSEGNLYRKLSFIEVRKTSPNYFYVHPSNGFRRESRIKYQKHKLNNRLDKFDPDKTESDNMLDNGFYKIWDCGNFVFEKIY